MKIIELVKDKDGIYKPNKISIELPNEKEIISKIKPRQVVPPIKALKNPPKSIKNQVQLSKFIVENGNNLNNFLNGLAETVKIVKQIKKIID